MKARCTGCKKKSAIVIATAFDSSLCRVCFEKDRKVKKSLINKIQDVAPQRAPLGYILFNLNCYADPVQGEGFCDYIYQETRIGALN